MLRVLNTNSTPADAMINDTTTIKLLPSHRVRRDMLLVARLIAPAVGIVRCLAILRAEQVVADTALTQRIGDAFLKLRRAPDSLSHDWR